MKIELTIKPDYLPTWGYQEGIRELLQNAKDAETQFDARMEIIHTGYSLKIINHGTSIPHEALLFGYTTKTDNKSLIGNFGEGLKLAALVLTRSGYNIKIRTGGEIWTPALTMSDKFNSSVLVFNIVKSAKFIDDVIVEIEGISFIKWNEIKENFLFLAEQPLNQVVETYASDGKLLLDPKYAGKIFVKGIFVQHDPCLKFGYDLKYADVDRDRRMISSCDINYRTTSIWSRILNENIEYLPQFLKLLYTASKDISDMSSYRALYFNADILAKIAEDFLSKYGANSFPVENEEQSREIEYYGKNGVVVNKAYHVMLTATFGSFDKIKNTLGNAIKKIYDLSELSNDYRSNLDKAFTIVGKVPLIPKCMLNGVDVVDFESPNLLGLFRDGHVYLKHDVLKDTSSIIRVLVHEIAHNFGDDGDKSHIDVVELIWQAIVRQLI